VVARKNNGSAKKKLEKKSGPRRTKNRRRRQTYHKEVRCMGTTRTGDGTVKTRKVRGGLSTVGRGGLPCKAAKCGISWQKQVSRAKTTTENKDDNKGGQGGGDKFL